MNHFPQYLIPIILPTDIIIWNMAVFDRSHKYNNNRCIFVCPLYCYKLFKAVLYLCLLTPGDQIFYLGRDKLTLVKRYIFVTFADVKHGQIKSKTLIFFQNHFFVHFFFSCSHMNGYLSSGVIDKLCINSFVTFRDPTYRFLSWQSLGLP